MPVSDFTFLQLLKAKIFERSFHSCVIPHARICIIRRELKNCYKKLRFACNCRQNCYKKFRCACNCRQNCYEKLRFACNCRQNCLKKLRFACNCRQSCYKKLLATAGKTVIKMRRRAATQKYVSTHWLYLHKNKLQLFLFLY